MLSIRYLNFLFFLVLIGLFASCKSWAIMSSPTSGASVGHRPVIISPILAVKDTDITIPRNYFTVGDVIYLQSFTRDDIDGDPHGSGAHCIWYKVEPNTNVTTIIKDPTLSDRDCQYTISADDVGFKIKTTLTIYSDQGIATSKNYKINPIASNPVDIVSANKALAPLTVKQNIFSRVIPVGNPIDILPLEIDGNAMPKVNISPSLPVGLDLDPASGRIYGSTNLEVSSTTYKLSVTNPLNSSPTNFTLTLAATKGPIINVKEDDRAFTNKVFSSYAPMEATSQVGGGVSYSVSPSLPAGLGLNSTNGIINGTPLDESPVVTYKMTVKDSKSAAESEASFKFSVAPELVVVNEFYVKSVAINNELNLKSINITGGVKPIVTISPNLPVGLIIDPTTGGISGKTNVITSPTVYKLLITDINGTPARERQITLSTTNGPVINAIDVKRVAIVQQSLNYTPVSANSISGGVVSYSVNPTLPAGLGLNSTNGVISGTPRIESKISTYTMTARDSISGVESSMEFELGIVPNFTVTQTTYSKVLSVGILNELDYATIDGGSGNYSYSSTPELPTELKMQLSGNVLKILGTPTHAIPSSVFLITISDDIAQKKIERNLTLTIK